MDSEETKELKELKPNDLVEDRYYYLTVGRQNIRAEKALFVRKEKNKGDIEYLFEINRHIVRDNMDYGMFESSNGGYWHVYRIDPKYSYIAESEFNNLLTKQKGKE